MNATPLTLPGAGPSRNPRVLLLVPEFPPRSTGGGGAVYLRLAEEYRRLGADVRVVALDVTRSGLFERPETERRAGYDVVYLPVAVRWVSRDTSFTGALPPSLPGIVALTREMHSGTWDVAHLHGVPMSSIDLGAFLARLRGRPYVLTVHGVVQAPARFGAPLALGYRAWFFAERWLYRRARAVTAVSQAMLNECRKIGLVAPRMVMIPVTPHPRPAATDSDPGQNWLTHHGLTKGSYVACVGNFTPRKGQDLLVEAVGRLAQPPDALPDLHVAFAGAEFGTGFRARLEERSRELGVRSRVVFLGRISNSERDTLYLHCRAAVVPTRYEASPMVAFEALELGLPLVASDIACLRELLQDGVNALLFASGDAAELAVALRRIWTQPELVAKLRAGALSTASGFPNWTDLARLYLEVLLERVSSDGHSGS